MATRILNWYWQGGGMPAFYAERDYVPNDIRIHSAYPIGAECQVDIRVDGVSILTDYARLGARQTLEELAGSFIATPSIAQGSMVTCAIVEPGGASALSIQLEMTTLDD